MASPTRSPFLGTLNLKQTGAALLTLFVPAVVLVAATRAEIFHGVLEWVAPLSLLGAFAVIAFLAYFYYVPEILGAKSCSPLPLAVRWQYWLRTSGFLLMATGAICLLSDHFVHHTTWVQTLSVMIVAGIPLGYAIAIVFFLLSRFAAPAPWPSNYVPKTSRFHRAVDHCGWPARWIARRMKPRFCASWGCLAVLLSLVFITSENFACSSGRTSGYEVLTTQGSWITATNFSQESFSFFADAAGKVFYSLALLVAIIALVRYVRRPALPSGEQKILSALVDVSGWVCLFFLTDLSLLAWFVAPLWIVYGVVPIALWLWFHRSPKWPLVRSFLVVLCLPMMVSSYIVLFYPISESVMGYVLLFLGSQLMWLGLAQIAREAADTVPEMETITEKELLASP